MAGESLSIVVLGALEQNQKIAKSLVAAYRDGGTRIVEKTLRGNLGDRGEGVADFLIGRIAKASGAAERALDIVSDQVTKAIRTVVDTVGGVENKYATKYFDLLGQISLPGARLARGLSGKLAEGSAKIHKPSATKASARTPRKPVKGVRKVRKSAVR